MTHQEQPDASKRAADDHDICYVCLGRDAWTNGQPRHSNPHPAPTQPQPAIDRYENPWTLWDIGWKTGEQLTRILEDLDKQ